MNAETPAVAAINRLTVIGIGLIGSSIALAAKAANPDLQITAYDCCAKNRETALRLGLVDAAPDCPKMAVSAADLTILCVPVGSIEAVCQQIGSALPAGSILSDVGSVKQSVIDQALPYLSKKVHFIPAHPIAGTEHSGPEAGIAHLFQNRWCILTPLPNTDMAALERLQQFWQGMGAQITQMPPQTHDRVLSVTSHIPHLIAYTMIGTARDLEIIEESDVIKYSASGFRDFTRIAASDPIMWRDVFLHNRDAVLEVLGRFTEDLFILQRAIRSEDADAMYESFSRARQIRQRIIEAGQDTDQADFGRLSSAPVESN